MSRPVGLIGGMSWQTTAIYYKEINQRVSAILGGIHSANLLLISLDYADIARMVETRDFDGMIKLFIENGKKLQDSGAQAIVLCANVAHKAAEALEKCLDVPVLHVADFTGRKIVERRLRKVGLLATRAVMEEDFYKSRLTERFGLEVVVPEAEFRAQADNMIFNELSKDRVSETVKASWYKAYMELWENHQVECVVLACTELRLVFNLLEMPLPTFETTILHAQGVADWAIAR